MARDDLKKLYNELVLSRLEFVPRGKHHITSIYKFVNQKYRSLCDDNYLCLENCNHGVNQPEWKHIVRGSIDALRKKSLIKRDQEWGYWILK